MVADLVAQVTPADLVVVAEQTDLLQEALAHKHQVVVAQVTEILEQQEVMLVLAVVALGLLLYINIQLVVMAYFGRTLATHTEVVAHLEILEHREVPAVVVVEQILRQAT